MRSLLAYSSVSLLSALIGFVSIPISTRLFGQELLGQLNLLLSLAVMLLTVSLVGMDQGYLRFYFDMIDSRRGALLRYCIRSVLGVAAIVSAVLIVGHDAVGAYIGGDPLLVTAVLIQLLITLILLRFSIYYCRVTESVLLFGALTIVNTIFNKCVYLFSFGDRTLSGALIAISIIAAIVAICSLVFLVKKVGEGFRACCRLNADEKKSIARYSIPLVPAMVLSNVNVYIPLFSIRLLLGFGSAGLFSMSVTLASVINIIGSGVNSFWPTYVFKNYHTKQGTIQLFHRVLVLSMFVFASLLMILRPLVSVFLGPGYEQSPVLFSILIITPLCYTIGETAGIGIQLSKKSYLFLVIYAVGIVSNVILSYALVYLLGLNGAAISTSVTASVMLLLKAVLGNRSYDSTGSLRWLASAIFLCCLQAAIVMVAREYVLTVLTSVLCLLLFPVLVGVNSFVSTIREAFTYLRGVIAERSLT